VAAGSRAGIGVQFADIDVNRRCDCAGVCAHYAWVSACAGVEDRRYRFKVVFP
jgi:hypothetical protein